MTCIVGCINKKTNSVLIGGDSASSNSYTKRIESCTKVFRHQFFKNVVMGSTTTWRHIDLLKYSKDIFPELDWYKKTDIDHEYMVTKFIPKLITLFEDGIKNEKDESKGANFLIGINDKLYEVQGDYSVLCPLDGFCSVGSGSDYATGSMITTANMDLSVDARIKLALESAEKGTPYVQRPFLLLDTVNEEEIVIK